MIPLSALDLSRTQWYLVRWLLMLCCQLGCHITYHKLQSLHQLTRTSKGQPVPQSVKQV